MKRLFVALAVFASRLRILPANFSPLGSFGFFGRSPLLYFASIVAFDHFIGGRYPGFLWTYLGFALYPLLGWYARRHWQRQVLLLPLASFGFFLFSNLSSFWYFYPHTLEGLLLCYTLALPFYLRTLSGDLFFGYGYLAWRALRPLVAPRLIHLLHWNHDRCLSPALSDTPGYRDVRGFSRRRQANHRDGHLRVALTQSTLQGA